MVCRPQYTYVLERGEVVGLTGSQYAGSEAHNWDNLTSQITSDQLERPAIVYWLAQARTHWIYQTGQVIRLTGSQ